MPTETSDFMHGREQMDTPRIAPKSVRRRDGTPTNVAIDKLLALKGWSVKNLADKIPFSEQSIQKWRRGGAMAPASREQVARGAGYASWAQLEHFVVPAGDAYALQQHAPDLQLVWQHYIDNGTSTIFETKIALGCGHGLMAATKNKLRRAIIDGRLTLHRVEQPRDVARLAELAANARYFNSVHYALRIVPPIKEAKLFTYPNFIRFGRRALVLGRTNKVGAPGANDPIVLMTGVAAESLGSHLQKAIWEDANALPFSTRDEGHRVALCRSWARTIAGAAGPVEFERRYRELTASTATMEALRV